mmetsp:Transcript_33988/g.51367  ORF Transcript_33988/g.51367 Transcript_33988/m.51367 type:complete len:179 (-) Transcript_33988:62-598(-)
MASFRVLSSILLALFAVAASTEEETGCPFALEDADEQLEDEEVLAQHVELLQRGTVVLARQKDLTQACPLDALIGFWAGKEGNMTVTPVADCSGVEAQFNIFGMLGNYTITPVDTWETPSTLVASEYGQGLKIRFTNKKLDYHHEGSYDPASDTLVEDLSHWNGTAVGGNLITMKRVN